MKIHYRMCGNRHKNKYAEGEQGPERCEICGLILKLEEFDQELEEQNEAWKEIQEQQDNGTQEAKKIYSYTRFSFRIPKLNIFLQIPDEPNGVILGRNGLGSEDEIWGPNISRKHLRLKSVNGGVFVEDMGSTNGTILNGKRLQKSERLFMNPGEKIILDAEINDIELVLVKNAARDM